MSFRNLVCPGLSPTGRRRLTNVRIVSLHKSRCQIERLAFPRHNSSVTADRDISRFSDSAASVLEVEADKYRPAGSQVTPEHVLVVEVGQVEDRAGILIRGC